jgi:hypothetical protein
VEWNVLSAVRVQADNARDSALAHPRGRGSALTTITNSPRQVDNVMEGTPPEMRLHAARTRSFSLLTSGISRVRVMAITSKSALTKLGYGP